MKTRPILAHFKEHTSSKGLSAHSCYAIQRGPKRLLEHFSFEEVAQRLNDERFEDTVRTALSARFSDLYTESLLRGVRQFLIFLRSFSTLDGIDLSELEAENILERFRIYMFERGYNRKYIRECVGVARKLFASHHLNEVMVFMCDDEFEKRYSAEVHTALCKGRAAKNMCGFRRFKHFLIDEQIIVANKPGLKIYKTKFPKFTEEIEQHILVDRNLDPSWARRHFRIFELFEEFLEEKSIFELSQIDAMTVLEFCETKVNGQSYATLLRNILKLMFRNGHNSKDYSFAVLRRRKRQSRSRKFISPDEVDRLLNSLPEVTPAEKRNKAMFYLFARLGLRVKETARIKLSDIDWIDGQLRINGKFEKNSILPLPQDVGDRILDYLRNSTRGNSDYLFLSARPPYGKYKKTDHLIHKLKRAYIETGISCPTPQTRLNVFRHSLATTELNSGTSLMSVKSLLRHEDVEVTMVYAKYNIESLRAFAMPWPEAVQ